MSPVEQDHLSSEALAAAVVDENGLRKNDREHLSICPVCRRERERIAGQLSLLGRTARMHAPEPVRRVVIPPAGERKPGKWSFLLQPAFGYVACVALVLIVVSLGYNRGYMREAYRDALPQEMADDSRLMAEVSALEENSLPDAYGRISPEDTAGIDDDTLDFVVPIDDKQGSPQGVRGKGGVT